MKPKFWAAPALLVLTAVVRADPDVAAATPPTAGPWKGQPPGAFVVFRGVAWDTGPVPIYRRELLLGVDGIGRPVVAYSQSDTPDGPWAAPKLLARAPDPDPERTVPLGRQTLTVDGQPVACDGTHGEVTLPDCVIAVEQWTDAATGRRVKTTRTTNGAGGQRTVILETLDKVETRQIGPAAVSAAVYTSKTVEGGVVRMTRRTALSDTVPGQRVSYQRWAGATDGGRAAVDEEAVGTGSDPEAATMITGLVPATQPTTRAAERP